MTVRRNCIKPLLLLSLAVIALLPASASDTQPPVLGSFTFTPTAVNTTNSSATVTATATITDNLSGVSYAAAEFYSPEGIQRFGCVFQLISGTNLNGTYQCTGTILAYSEAGTWYVDYVYVEDNAGNQQYYYTSDLQSLGFPTNLQVTSNPDTTPPVLTSFTFTPTSVNTTYGSATITATAQATDNLSGVASLGPLFLSPSGVERFGCDMTLISGTDLNGTFQCVGTIDAYSEPGTWTVSYVFVEDNIGNEQIYDTSQLQAMGFPTQLQVTSNPDTTPPVVTSFTFTPTVVNTATGSATITVTAQITDNLSGVESEGAGALFLSPSGEHYFGCDMTLISGTDLNGTYQCTATAPAFSEAGTWTVSYVFAIDNVGNEQIYYSGQLQALGLPVQLVVDSGTFATVVSSNNPSSYGQPITFTATVASSNGNTPTGTVNFNDNEITVGSARLNAGGVATFTTSSLAVTTNSMFAAYLGDANNPPQDSVSVGQVVNQAATTTTVVSSKNPSIAGHLVAFTASVSFANGVAANGDPVEFFDEQGKLGIVPVSDGKATLATSNLTVGNHQIWAEYLGDRNLKASTSAKISQRVIE
jgi:hypothetical protein